MTSLRHNKDNITKALYLTSPQTHDVSARASLGRRKKNQQSAFGREEGERDHPRQIMINARSDNRYEEMMCFVSLKNWVVGDAKCIDVDAMYRGGRGESIRGMSMSARSHRSPVISAATEVMARYSTSTIVRYDIMLL